MLIQCKDLNENLFANDPILRNHLPMLEKIKSTYGPEDNVLFIKAPGRINLIGEHTDYNMGPVLPCAIDKEIVFCLRESNSALINFHNIDSKFEILTFSVDQPVKPYATGHWGNYIKAGIKGIIDYLQANDPDIGKKLRGFDAIVSGTLPQAAGLSSSSALVVASALSLVLINDLDIDKKTIAEICADAEHFVGTAGGGMDQAACLLGQNKHFMRMSFNPLVVHQIPCPPELRLTLFHSLIHAEKSGAARTAYNQRVLECRLAMHGFNIFLTKRNIVPQKPLGFIGQINETVLELSPEQLNTLISEFLISLPEIVEPKGLYARYPDLKAEIENWLKVFSDHQIQSLNLKYSFKFVYQECKRVDRAVLCLENNDLSGLGALLNQTHRGLRDEYRVSHPNADRLVEVLQSAGALGARIMGAGFGGMVLAISTSEMQKNIIDQARIKYYKNRESTKHIITCNASQGAGTIEL